MAACRDEPAGEVLPERQIGRQWRMCDKAQREKPKARPATKGLPDVRRDSSVERESLVSFAHMQHAVWGQRRNQAHLRRICALVVPVFFSPPHVTIVFARAHPK